MEATSTQKESNHFLEEDEIDLKELFSTIWKNKLKIIFLSFVVTSLSVLYVLFLPNSYKSSTSLTIQTQTKPSLGGLGALAGMAGIDIGGGSGIDPVTSMEAILNDYAFERYMIKKYDLAKKLLIKKENLVFALGYDGIYKIFHSDKNNKQKDEEEIIFDTFKKIISTLSIVSDKKTSMITFSAEIEDRFLAKELVDVYLKEITAHLRTLEMQDVQKQIDYYKNELDNTVELSLKDQLSGLISGLVQKKVLSLASEYYNVSQLTKPQVAYIKDKTKPKRALIVIIAFVTSIILGIFMVFFIEFFNKEENAQ